MAKKTQKGDNQHQIYTFLDYEVNPNSREIHQIKTHLKVSKKSFDILILLIEKQGQVVTKKEIIDRVWPNQIVTDAALNKQLTRLRNDLVSHKSSHQTIIETVRGVGVKLAPVVQSISTQSHKKPNVSTWVIALITIVSLYFLIGYYRDYPKTPATKTSEEHRPLNIVLIPTQKTIDWLNVGGLNYLSEQLQKHAEIQTINPHTEWFKSEEQQSIAIELSQADGIDYVLAANTYIKDKSYFTNLVLRQHNGIVAKTSIQAMSLSTLFDKIDSWVIRQLNLRTTVTSGEVFSYKTTDYVLESYLRGREVAIHNSYEKALQLFKTATNEDTGFLPAWTAQAEMEARLGNNKKALAIIETISQGKNFNPSLLNKMLVLKANFLVGLNQIEQANLILDQTMLLSEQKHDFVTLIDAITIKIQTHFNTGNINQETVDLLIKQISLLGDYKPDPYLRALAGYNLASAYHQLGQVDLAIKSINISIELYTSTNNIRGIVISNSLLARIYKDMGHSGRALLTLDKIQGHYQQMDGVDEQQIYLQYKAENQTYYGLRKEAAQTIEKLTILSQKSAKLEPKIVALSLRFELNQIHKDYKQAQVNVQQMLTILENESQAYPPIYNDLIQAYDMFIKALVDEPKAARLVVKQHLESNPNIKSFFEKELRMIEATILTKEGKIITAVEIYHDLIDEYVESNQIQDALYYAGYPLLDIQWQNNRQDYIKTMNYLNEIAVFKYPIHKYKAQYLAFNKDYINAYVMMVDLKSKANQFWTTNDQILLEKYQQQANGTSQD